MKANKLGKKEEGEEGGEEEEEKLDSTNVFVKFLPPNYVDLSLYKLFEPFGRIISAKVMTDPQTGKSMGYGYNN